jgi:hypothetical protein
MSGQLIVCVLILIPILLGVWFAGHDSGIEL